MIESSTIEGGVQGGWLAIDGGPRRVRGQYREPWPDLASSTRARLVSYVAAGEALSIADGGGIVEELERAFGTWQGAPHVLSTNSGSTALHSAFVALNLPAGSEVVAPVYTFHASISTALHARLTPVLADVEPATGNLCPEALLRALTPRTRAVVLHHNCGHPGDARAVVEICRSKGLWLIEDCSHAFGSRIGTNLVGNFGDIAVFSLQANKMLPAGEGGLLTTKSRELYERAVMLGHYRGRSRRDLTDAQLSPYAETGLGLKYRIHPLAAVIAREELRWLDERIATRRELMERLSEHLRDCVGVEPPSIREGVEMGCYFSYRPRLLPERLSKGGRSVSFEELLCILQAEGVPAHRPSVAPLCDEPLFQEATLPVAAFTDTWRPRLCRPFSGLEQYLLHRVSLPVFTRLSARATIDDYGAAFRKVGAALAG